MSSTICAKSRNRVEQGYAWCLRGVVRHPLAVMAVYAVLGGVTAWGFLSLPTGFLPVEDKGYFIISAQLPDAAALDRTRQVVDRLTDIARATPGIENVIAITGQNVFDQTTSSNAAACYVTFKDWGERGPGQSQDAILARLGQEFRQVPEAVVLAFPPPAIRGLGVSGGFQMEVQDLGNVGLAELEKVARDMVRAGNAQSDLRALNTPFSASVPQLYLNIDRTKVKSLNLPLNLVFNTLQTYLGSTYVNDFNEFSRTWQVRLQADARFRDRTEDIARLEVRNNDGEMVPLGTLLSVERRLGPQTVPRYNLYPAASITGQAAPGTSSGQALAIMEELSRDKLPPGMGYEWTAMSYQEKAVGNQALYVFALAVLLVYLVLAAQYESWTSPAAVILVVPLALLGTVAAVALRGSDNNIYTQFVEKRALLSPAWAKQRSCT
jgi:HAE1 family hydrophobic/amphiphilic exporter-1